MKSPIKTALKGLSISVVLFIAFVMLINTSLFDEELKPEIKKIMQDIPMPVVQGNAYYALMGLSADKDIDMVEAGHALILRYMQNREKGNDEITSEDYEEILGTKNTNASSEWQNNFDFCDARKDLDCLTKSSESITDEFLNDPRLQVMITRYNKIIQMNTFENLLDITWSTPLVSYGELLKLTQIKMAAAYRPQHRTEFILHLNKDMQFWKMHLDQGKFLIDKMVAFAGIRKNLNYLSEYIRNNEIIESEQVLITQMLNPLTKQNLDFSENFIAESRMMFNLETLSDPQSPWYENFVYQANATKNYFYEHQLKKQLELSQLSLNELILELESEKTQASTGFKLHYLYNFTGKTLVDLSAFLFTDYIARGHDINNIITLVNLQLQVKLSDKQSIQQLLLKPENVNPFNKKPYDYDETDKLVQFDCLDNHYQCQIKL